MTVPMNGIGPEQTAQEKEFLDELISKKLLIPTGVPGVYGRGAVFEDVLLRFDALITRIAANDGAEVMRFPPILNRKHFEASEFLKSFPHLAGAVTSFEGTHSEHMSMLEKAGKGEDWLGHQKMTDVVLAPAACYPVYPTVSGTLPEGGKLVDVFAYCFRHEPSGDPSRMQMFRMREFIRIADADAVVPWRDLWRDRGLELLKSLGLPVFTDVANDPFFGRGGKLLAVNQREQKLKFELLVPVCSTEKPTAIMSFNYHQDHFGTRFGIKTHAGETSHTACVGFGMERITLALLKHHGCNVADWPAATRAQLWA